MVFPTTQTFSDGVSTAVVCSDGTCLCCSDNNIISLPFAKISGNSTFHALFKKNILETVGVEPENSSVFRVYKIFLPNPNPPKFFTHIVFVMSVTPEAKKNLKAATGRYNGKVKWIGESDLARLYTSNSIYTPALLELFPKILTDANAFCALENDCTNVLTEVAERCLINQLVTNAEITVDLAGLRAQQNLVYKEFIAASYPNVLMSFTGFSAFFAEQGIAKDDLPHLFRAADIGNRRFLTYRDFISLLAVLEPTTNHGGIAGEVRCRYIFRFFDRDGDGCLSLEELKEMITYMRRSKGQPVDPVNVDKEFKAQCTALGCTENKPLGLADFLKSAGELKFRGLSQLLRFTKSIKAAFQLAAKVESKFQMIESAAKTNKSQVIPQGTKQAPHEIAVHSIKLQKSATMINIENIWMLKDVASPTTLEQANITKESRRSSIQINAQDSLCNELIKNLRSLVFANRVKSGNRGNKAGHYNWGSLNSAVYGHRLIQICTKVAAIFKQEPRMLDLKSPMYILGDLHGNFGDLQLFENMFWPLGPMFCPCDLLFLGDYVDRGHFGIEIITYLFCYKLLCPQKLKMVRGNHEIREIQKAFTFYTECVSKFGDKVGAEVWENINKVFDVMPIAAIVDEKLFCCHGGIPPPWLCPVVSAINTIPSLLAEPDTQSTLAWDIMWNDPIRSKQLTPDLESELKHNEGFAANTRRGTAHVFNQHGLNHFLKINGFSHVIRAHEVALAGYSILLKGKLITIFSSSNYNGGNNHAACILVDKGKLRMMRLDPNA